MELAIVLIVSCFVVWWFIFRNKKDVEEALSPAPYKVEVAPVVEETTIQMTAPSVVKEKSVKKVEAKKPSTRTKSATTKTTTSGKAASKSKSKKSKTTPK
jgi:hypothetical protein